MHTRRWLVAGAALAAFGLLATPAAGAGPAPVRRGHHVQAPRELRAQALGNTLLRTHGGLDYCSAHGMACNLTVLTTFPGSDQIVKTGLPAGIGPGDLEAAYSLTGAESADGIIAIIDAGAFPPKDLEASLATYRGSYGLPPCTLKSGCLTVLDRLGGQALQEPKNELQQHRAELLGTETMLDVEMASAACPGCTIVELQLPATDGFFGSDRHTHQAATDFGEAVQTAVSLGASAVSISYGFPADATMDGGPIAARLDQVGTTITVSSGDSGYVATQGSWPQNLRTVISVGGTTLTASGRDPRGFKEKAWPAGGSSCSPDLAPAVGQPDSVSASCNGMRTSDDLSSDAALQIAAYDGYAPDTHDPLGWFVAGGTSASAPFVGAIAARAPRIPGISGPNVLYADPASAFNDVATGYNGGSCARDGFAARLCTAKSGWDGPTGLGTPRGLRPFTG